MTWLLANLYDVLLLAVFPGALIAYGVWLERGGWPYSRPARWTLGVALFMVSGAAFSAMVDARAGVVAVLARSAG